MPESTETSDHDALLLGCARGERDALRRLYELEARRMTGVALRIVRDRGLAEDVVQDVFVRVWEKASSFDPARGAARGWLYSVLRHRALNVVRDRGPQLVLDVSTVEALEAIMAGQGAAPPLAEFGSLRDCLQRLDASRRTSIVLAYVDGCTHGEIAERMSAPLGTVKAWIRRGLQALKDCLS